MAQLFATEIYTTIWTLPSLAVVGRRDTHMDKNILSSSNGYVGKNRVIGAAARQLKKREQIFPFLGCLLTVHVI